MAAATDEPTDQMILQRASGAEKLHGIFIFVGNRAHLVQEFLLAVLLLTAAPAFGWEPWAGDRCGRRISPLAQNSLASLVCLARLWTNYPAALATTPAPARHRLKLLPKLRSV